MPSDRKAEFDKYAGTLEFWWWFEGQTIKDQKFYRQLMQGDRAMARRTLSAEQKALFAFAWSRPRVRAKLKAKYGVGTLQDLLDYVLAHWDEIAKIIQFIMDLVKSFIV